MTMLVINNLENWVERLKRLGVSAEENGNLLGDCGVKFFSLQFRQFIQAIADFDLPALTPSGRYVCKISAGSEPVKIVWVEPVDGNCDPRLYDVCLLTDREINIKEDSLEKLWQTFMDKLRRGLADFAKKMLDEVDACRGRFSICAEIIGKLNRASDYRMEAL
jgi:hypothetical protein